MNLEKENNIAATTSEVLEHHLNSLGDIVSTMADYRSESKFFTPEGVLRGAEEIRSFFVNMFEEFNKPGTYFEMLRQEVDGETAYIVWKAETAVSRYEVGSDTFIVRNGKIVTQTFAGKISPKR
jgi:predicted SnoaL-like aldol condensation-catalyzing enzyme